ncbi:MAG: hypothetical protein HKL80_09365 [Acidimicrobiales bacterium]|nr:hypothetical protein [Acidimicrobiales bacterium]
MPATSSCQVAVISGSIGAGKTSIIEKRLDISSDSQIPCGAIDLEWLCQVNPSLTKDKYATEFGFKKLSLMLPNYRVVGVSHLIIARVIETKGDLEMLRCALPRCNT